MNLDQICTFKEWVEKMCDNKHTFRVPEYQRTYSWGKDNAETLLEDLRNNNEYFLGLFLLEVNNNEYSFIDGQQRFTTIFMLLFVLYKEKIDFISDIKTRKLIENFIYYGEDTLRLSLQVEQNGEFFKKITNSSFEKLETQEVEYFSQKNIKDVISFFYNEINKLTELELQKILCTILKSKILLHPVDNTGQAMKIFELLNDRGKTLTELETLKSFIMHQIYIKSRDDDKIKENHLETIKCDFIEIYKALNKICNITKTNFREDDILRYYYIAFENWNDPKDWYKVKDKLKDVLYGLNTIEELKSKTKSIRNAFVIIQKILENAHNNKYLWLKNLYILGRMATFYPLLMAIENKYPQILNLVCNYLELFTYRTFGIMNKRTNTGLNQFHKLARAISHNGYTDMSEKKIIIEIKDIINKAAGKTKEHEFENNLNSPYFYFEQQGIDGRYILIKYENFLRYEIDKQEATPITALAEITNFESKTKNSLSIEHIVAQNLVKNSPEYIREVILGKDIKSDSLTDYWRKKGFKKYVTDCFEENFLHCLGNLVISKLGANSSKGDAKPDEKHWSGFKSQEEIKIMIEDNQRKRGTNKWRRKTPFNVDNIIIRQDKISKFATKYWSYTYIDQEEDRDITERKPLI